MHWLSITNEFPHQISSTFYEYDPTLIRDFIKDRNLMLWIPRSTQNLTCIELNSIGIPSVVTKKSFHNEGLASYSNIFPCRPWENAVHHLQQHWPCTDAHWLSKSYQDIILVVLIGFFWFNHLQYCQSCHMCKVFWGNKLFLTMLKTFTSKIGNRKHG